MTTLHHRVSLRAPHTHFVDIETTVAGDGAALPAEVVLFMPVWTPGSYLVREYARHVEELRADAPAAATKSRKNAWRVATGARREVTVRYRLYANELTVRTNHVTDTHALLQGAATFLAVEGAEQLKATVEISAPDGFRVATELPRVAGKANVFEAPDLDTLVDCPIEVGLFREEAFTVLGKPHRFVFWPPDAIGSADVTRLIADTTTILRTEAALFGGDLPYESYLFLLYLSPRGRGGLEHRTSCTLLASPASFANREGYADLLSLVAHEAFHLWNVKRMRPGGLTPYRYQEENYTRLLWWFEGATSYFDWRVLRLSKLCTLQEYLDHLAGEIAHLDVTHGRLVHPLEEASFDAWIKLYRPDENSQNSTVSYYRKGEVVCALLDIELRARSNGRASLDTVLRALWERFGAKGLPVPEGAMPELFDEISGVKMGDCFDAWVRSAKEIDYGEVLGKMGLAIERSPKPDGPETSLGVRLREGGGRAVVAGVARGSAAFHAGVDPGDELVAIGGARIEGTSLDAALRGRKPGDVVDVLVARDGRMTTRQAKLDPPRDAKVKLVPAAGATEAVRARFAAWLGEPLPSVEAK